MRVQVELPDSTVEWLAFRSRVSGSRPAEELRRVLSSAEQDSRVMESDRQFSGFIRRLQSDRTAERRLRHEHVHVAPWVRAARDYENETERLRLLMRLDRMTREAV